MKIKTFKTLAKKLPNYISILIRGKHGIGKSGIVYQLAEELGLPVMERRLSQLTEGDLIGLPFKVEKNDNAYSTRFLPMDWFCECMEKPYVIFLDEWDRAQTEVLQSTFELVLDRSIQGNKIHPGCVIVAAINGGEHGAQYQVQQLDPALLDRVWISDLKPTVSEWIEWGTETKEILPTVLSFIDKQPQCLEDQDGVVDLTKVSPSRRSWHRLCQTIKKPENTDVRKLMEEIDVSKGIDSEDIGLFMALCTGFIGVEATNMFINFLSDQNKYFKAENVLNEFKKHKEKLMSLKTEDHTNIVNKIESYFKEPHEFITSSQLSNLSDYIDILPKELVISLVGRLSSAIEQSDFEERKKIVEMASSRVIALLKDS